MSVEHTIADDDVFIRLNWLGQKRLYYYHMHTTKCKIIFRRIHSVYHFGHSIAFAHVYFNICNWIEFPYRWLFFPWNCLQWNLYAKHRCSDWIRMEKWQCMHTFMIGPIKVRWIKFYTIFDRAIEHTRHTNLIPFEYIAISISISTFLCAWSFYRHSIYRFRMEIFHCTNELSQHANELAFSVEKGNRQMHILLQMNKMFPLPQKCSIKYCMWKS